MTVGEWCGDNMCMRCIKGIVSVVNRRQLHKLCYHVEATKPTPYCDQVVTIVLI